MNEATATSEPRAYRKRARAHHEEATRQRIVDAAIDLHATQGFPGASVSAIAERAGVGRVTVYRHFPDYDAILDACTSHYMELHPPPAVQQWESIVDPAQLLQTVVCDAYDYFQANEPIFTHGAADAVTLPFLAQRMGEIGAYWSGVRDWLLARLLPGETLAPSIVALSGVLLSFGGWQALVRQQGLTFEMAKTVAIDSISTVLWNDPQP
ncbi:MAG: TetR/AcrR family transcriptional regulator [Thermomicrobiales bacterium]|nr:TetR/AcrR family transcriptional regulator [Thermomicrobiales bacterium]